MAKVQKDLKYTENHEWAKIEGKTMKVGVTDYAQHAMGTSSMSSFPTLGPISGRERICASSSR